MSLVDQVLCNYCGAEPTLEEFITTGEQEHQTLPAVAPRARFAGLAAKCQLG